MPTKDLCTHFYCAAGSCENKALWKIRISEYEFITACDSHVLMYVYVMGGKNTRLTPNEGMQPGWDYIRSRYRWRGAYNIAHKRKVQSAKRR